MFGTYCTIRAAWQACSYMPDGKRGDGADETLGGLGQVPG